MNGRLSFRFFAHSWISDWNHGNAHFLRGLVSELAKLGHEVRCYEERNSWSMNNLAEEGPEAAAAAFTAFREAFPSLDVRFYTQDSQLQNFLMSELAGVDVVVLHEWNPLELITAVLALKPKLRFRALFHDTHHRAYTVPGEIIRLPLNEFDGVLAFGDAITRIYKVGFGVSRVWTFHEAADTAHFFPGKAEQDTDVVWIGNWGDEERTQELEEFLIAPAAAMREYNFAVHGVRYPESALQRMRDSGIALRGYLPNLAAPQMYARSKISLHVPRRFYANGLSGVPTIRVFEALAAGSPLVCSPWSDTEGLFRPEQDYACVPNSHAMIAELKFLLRDPKARQQLANSGLETICARHTCAHRAQQLLEIRHEMEASPIGKHWSLQLSANHQRPTTKDVVVANGQRPTTEDGLPK